MKTSEPTQKRSPALILPALVLPALAVCSLASLGMVAVRVLHTGHRSYSFMAWNLVLAWIQLLLSYLTSRSFAKAERLGVVTLALGFLWLIFLPNAPYMVTDVLHLHTSRHAPAWYDLILLISFAWTGLLLGYVSLYLMHDLVIRSWGVVTGWLFVIVVLGLSSFGIYLGRFLRWNSWDVLVNMSGVIDDVLRLVLNPFEHPRTFVMSFFMMVMLFAFYLVIYSLTRIRR